MIKISYTRNIFTKGSRLVLIINMDFFWGVFRYAYMTFVVRQLKRQPIKF
jgi:hypothetical protein